MMTEIITDRVDDIIVIENFLSPRYLEILQEGAREADEDRWWNHSYSDVDFWNGRYYNANELAKTHLYTANIMVNERKRIMKIIKELFNKEELYSDLCQFVRWYGGYELFPHADSENPDGSQHPFPYREFASITYLNDDFNGGEIYFPNKDNFSPKIKPGMLVIFPGTLEYLHGVREVTEGIRYTIASFYTTQKEHSDNDFMNLGLGLG